jgi:hypothetical protein
MCIQTEKVDMASLIDVMAKKIVLYETPNIHRGILSTSRKPDNEGQMIMKTEGVNIPVRITMILWFCFLGCFYKPTLVHTNYQPGLPKKGGQSQP